MRVSSPMFTHVIVSSSSVRSRSTGAGSPVVRLGIYSLNSSKSLFFRLCRPLPFFLSLSLSLSLIVNNNTEKIREKGEEVPLFGIIQGPVVTQPPRLRVSYAGTSCGCVSLFLKPRHTKMKRSRDGGQGRMPRDSLREKTERSGNEREKSISCDFSCCAGRGSERYIYIIMSCAVGSS